MRHYARDFATVGLYLAAVAALVGCLTMGSAVALRAFSENPRSGWLASVLGPEAEQETRLSQAVLDAREIRAALAKPIAVPEPLPPITAKLAFGHLRTGTSKMVHARRPRQPALDAMAMGVPASAYAYTPPELHKVY